MDDRQKCKRQKKNMMLDTVQTPSDWLPTYPGVPYTRVKLDFYDSSYRRVEKMLGEIPPNRIERIQNPYLWGCYQLKKEEMRSKSSFRVQEWELWHATDETNVESIAMNNFDWRRTTRNKFGKGVSFSGDPMYANRYCNQQNGCDRVLILSLVLVQEVCNGHPDLDIPGHKADTSTGNNGKVFVKYNDNEFYPLYVAFYSAI